MPDRKELAAIPPGDPTLPERYASLVVDALVDAGLVRREDFGEAVRIAAVEILVRQSLGDR
jgi:hypothetical protein